MKPVSLWIITEQNTWSNQAVHKGFLGILWPEPSRCSKPTRLHSSSTCMYVFWHPEHTCLRAVTLHHAHLFAHSISFSITQFSSVAQSCPTLCNPLNHSMPGLLVHHQLLEFTQTHAHRVSDAIQPSHPLSSPSAPAHNPSQHQGLFQWVNSSHEVAKVLVFQLQHQSI